jgi:hypothetical protein
VPEITQSRAERVARSHPCPVCGEYSFKKLKVTRASKDHQRTLSEYWHVTRTCGVCGAHDEVGLDAEGDIVYGG